MGSGLIAQIPEYPANPLDLVQSWRRIGVARRLPDHFDPEQLMVSDEWSPGGDTVPRQSPLAMIARSHHDLPKIARTAFWAFPVNAGSELLDASRIVASQVASFSEIIAPKSMSIAKAVVS